MEFLYCVVSSWDRFVWPVGDGQIGHGTIWFEMFVPYFSEAEFVPTRSELECPPDAFLTAELADRYLRLALPEGATRDHPAVNLVGPEAPPLPAVAMPPLLVVAAGRDVLRDRNAQYAAQMREWGKDVEFAEVAGEQHVFFLLNARSESADDLVRLVRRFVVQHMDA
jgi:acetyl esterase/lipase